MVSSIIPPNSGCNVGSPFPANVMTSGIIDSVFIFNNSPLRRVLTSVRVGRITFLSRFFGFQPHSQYMQSNEQSFESLGSRLIPNEIPNLLLITGPNIVLSKRNVDMNN